MPVIYLLHFVNVAHFAHYLGVAPSEAEIASTPVRQGRGVKGEMPRLIETGRVQLADVWPADSHEDAQRLIGKLRKQGSRKGLCSICNPGNGRGQGRGKWRRKWARQDATETS